MSQHGVAVVMCYLTCALVYAGIIARCRRRGHGSTTCAVAVALVGSISVVAIHVGCDYHCVTNGMSLKQGAYISAVLTFPIVK